MNRLDRLESTPGSEVSIPAPPADTMLRQHGSDDFGAYLRVGAASRQDILSMLPAEWTFPGKRVLDMGCGAGRTLRHFLDEAETCELWGCDIDEASVEWLGANLTPPVRVMRGAEHPPLPFPDGFFDLIWCVSLFTHLTNWAEWLAELHRLVAEDGLVICTYHGGPYAGAADLPLPWAEERAGLVIVGNGVRFTESTGPAVFCSGHWLERHWGRAFEIVEHRPTGFAGYDPGQGLVLMRPRPGAVDAAELERIDESDPREVEGLRYQVEMLLAEIAMVRESYEGSASWRITRPLRRLKGLLRRRRAA